MKQLCYILLLIFPFIHPMYARPLHSDAGDYERRLREAELSGDRQRVAAVCQEWYASGQYSPGLLDWNYNALMSVEQDALLVTQQESDTYPAFLLQYALSVRPDVAVANLQWLEEPTYRAALIAAQGLSWIPSNCTFEVFWKQLLQRGEASPKPLYFGSMTHKNLQNADKSRLYLTGLAMKYSVKPFDNVAVLRHNFEQLFRTDYLSLQLAPEKDPASVTLANMHYIPGLSLLYRHYAASGESEKAKRLQQLALRLARAGNRESEVRALFAPESANNGMVYGLSPKNLEKGMKKVSHRLYAAETEVTNAQYEAFLADLLKNKDFEQISICKNTKTDWVSLLPENLQDLPDAQLFKHGHPDGANFPVQNISHEAAKRYCAWITAAYNASTDKKKFKKVIFRLPTEAEWMAAARGGLNEVAYPWGGSSVQNAKGCYLGNFNSLKPCGDCPGQTTPAVALIGTVEMPAPSQQSRMYDKDSNDGGFFPVEADSYYPNRFGLYAVSGNVAEMLDEAGMAKGGSWQDAPEQAQITASKRYPLPNPAVGFRVFMEVIEVAQGE